MNILSFDLELNQDPSGPKIIEIGACVGSLDTGTVLESYSAFVNPHQPITEFITQLTSITQADVDNAGSVEEAYQGMITLAKRYDCLTLPIVWGGGDGRAIRAELPPGVEWLLGRRELDVESVFQAYQMAKGEKVQAGLSKAMTRLDLQFKGKKHRADQDAINTFVIYWTLLKHFH